MPYIFWKGTIHLLCSVFSPLNQSQRQIYINSVTFIFFLFRHYSSMSNLVPYYHSIIYVSSLFWRYGENSLWADWTSLLESMIYKMSSVACDPNQLCPSMTRLLSAFADSYCLMNCVISIFELMRHFICLCLPLHILSD